MLDEVGPRFRKTGELSAADFLTILIWKAERAKNRHKKRLKKICGGTFEDAVHQIASGLQQSTSHKSRLELLIKKWWFLLPTATAILSLLYPEDFTVYDWRVCDELGCDYEPWCSRDFSDALWDHYQSFKQAVISQAPAELSLRDKDRFLIGRSTRKSIEADSKS